MKLIFFLITFFVGIADAQAFGACKTAGLTITGGVDPRALSPESGNRVWYIDGDAAEDATADGTISKPYNSFEEVAGYLDSQSSYQVGLISGGDIIALKGTFSATDHVDYTNEMLLHLARDSQFGPPSNPTVITSWPGEPRAKWDLEFTLPQAIQLVATTNATQASVLIRNIEIENGADASILVQEDLTEVTIDNVYLHNHRANGGGINSPITLQMRDTNQVFTVKNSLFKDMTSSPSGSINNRSALAVDSEPVGSPPAVSDYGLINILDNRFENVVIAQRHKHAGYVDMVSKRNCMKDAYAGYYLRQLNNDISANEFANVENAVIDAHDNPIADKRTLIHSNIGRGIFNVVEAGSERQYKREIDMQSNEFCQNSSSSQSFLILGENTSPIEYEQSDWTSHQNDLYMDLNDNYLTLKGVTYNQANGLSQLSDSTTNISALTACPSQLSVRIRK